MKYNPKQIIFYISIYIKLFLISNVICKERNNREGKCVYLNTETGSEIINFYKFKNNKYKYSPNYIINKNEKDKWFINFCNDTTYKNITEDNNRKEYYNSQIVYTDNEENKFFVFTGGFFKQREEGPRLKLNKTNKQYSYSTNHGDICNKKDNINYKTTIIFEEGNVIDKEYVEIYHLPNKSNCTNNLNVYFDLDYSKDYLILQKVLNDGYIFTSIIFILLGIYLCFLTSINLPLTKVIISLVFGQIIMFTIEILFVGNSSALKGYLYILILIIGLLVGGVIGFLSCIYDKFYLIILSFSSGFVNAIFVFDICFIGSNCTLTPIILIDVILIFTISFIALIRIVPKNYIYYPPVIGSYTLIRGISLIIYNASGKYGYRDLQLLLFLTTLNENDFLDEFLKNDFKYFWVYIIFICLILILSEIIAYLIDKKMEEKDFYDDEEEEKEEKEESEENKTELSGHLIINQDNSRNSSESH